MKLAVISDLHYYSPRLGTSGTAFRERERMCQYFLRESGAICDAAFKEIAESDADATIVCGDITNNGEMVCHEEIIEKLRVLKASKPVYVIYATHDWCCGGHPKRYDGANTYDDVETATPKGLAEMYREFGREDAVSEFVHENGSVSYCVDLDDKTRLLCLNDDRNGKGKAGYTDEQRNWIARMCRESGGREVLAMEHHLIIPGISELVNGTQLVGDASYVRRFLADCGVKYVFCGHSHMQRVSKLDGVYQINAGALTGHPCGVVYFTLDGGKAVVDARGRLSFDFGGKHYTEEDVRRKTTSQIEEILRDMSESKEKFRLDLDALGVHISSIPLPDSLVTGYGKKLYSGTVGDVLKTVNRIVRVVDKDDLKAVEHDSFIGYVRNMYLSVFDGSVKTYPRESTVYRIIMAFADNPQKLQKLPVKQFRSEKFARILRGVRTTADRICVPEYDALYAELK